MRRRRVLRVHFLNAVALRAARSTGPPRITGGETIPTVAVLRSRATDWGCDDGHAVLTLARRRARRLLALHADDLRARCWTRSSTHVAFSFKARLPVRPRLRSRRRRLPAAARATRRRSTIWPRTSSASARRCSISRRCAIRTGRSAPKPTSA